MNILVCGGRDFDDYTCVKTQLDNLLTACGLSNSFQIIQGGAAGADTLARNWAIETDINVITYKADWKKYGKAAGFIRNQVMLDNGKPDLVVAFPGGRGTADMVSRARQADIPVIIVPRTNSCP